MHSFKGLLFLLLVAISQLTTASWVDSRAPATIEVPACGLQCLLSAIPTSTCGPFDIACQCRDQDLQYRTAECMLANCTMNESWGTSRYISAQCGLPKESKATKLLVSLTVVFGVVCVSVVLRIITKIITQRVRLDDYVILLALVLTTATYFSAYMTIQNGFGKHLWDLKSGQLQIALKYFFVCWNLYVINLGLVKVSLIILYLHIFQGRRFRICCYVMLSEIIVSTIIIQCLTIFACSPIQSFWDRDIKGKCLNVNSVAFANSANAILQDLIILGLPMPILFGLKMNTWRKIPVIFMFAVGTFGCITTIIRLRALMGFTISIDPTWDYVEITIWTAAELAAGIVCASLPAIRQLLTMILPARFKHLLTTRTRTRSQSRNTPAFGGGSRSGAHQRKIVTETDIALTSIAENGSETWGTTTDITSSKIKTKSGLPLAMEKEFLGHEHAPRTNRRPLRDMFHSRSRLAHGVSSFDRIESPETIPTSTRYSAEKIESAQKLSDEEESQLIQPPESIRRISGRSRVKVSVDVQRAGGTAVPISRYAVDGTRRERLDPELGLR